MREFGIGRAVTRLEDRRLLGGQGRYTDDFRFAGEAHLYVLRSPHASARIAAVDTTDAETMPGVLTVLTAGDIAADGIGSIPSRVKRPAPDGTPNVEPPYPVLVDQARFVGDAVAAVVAETLSQARDAAERIAINYDILPSVTATAEAMEPNAHQVWDQAPGNLCFLHEQGDEARVTAAFADAAHVSRLDYTINRISANPMEPRNAVGLHDRADGRYTLYAGIQAPHSVRGDLARFALNVPEAQVRIVSPDCGGGFGMKESLYPEHVLVLWAAKRLGRPVRWQADRSEGHLADYHARDQVSTIEMALDRDGGFLAIRVETTANLGAYLCVQGNHSPVANLGGLAGTYQTPAIFARVKGVFTHTSPTAPYRGAGRPEATYPLERIIDQAAREMGLDRIALRRRNTIPADAMPYDTGYVFTYDSGEFEASLDAVLDLADWDGFEARRAAAKERGVMRGIGLSSFIEIAGGPPNKPFEEHVEVRFDPDGAMTLIAGTHSHGQGHETVFTQLAVEALGVDPEHVRIVYGDTDQVFHGRGTIGSRSAALVSNALHHAAAKVIEQGKLIAGHLLEAAATDIDFEDGMFAIRGTDRAVAIDEVARAAFDHDWRPAGLEAGLGAAATVSPQGPTFPNGCHVCEVEVDPSTGVVQVVGYCVVDDVGRIINPTLVDGQVHGGVAQGIGEALMEVIRYDPSDGQLLSGSFMDYAMPRADDLPLITIETREVPARTNALGIKGCGEAGTIGALPAVMNAIVDALAPLGVTHVDMPATPETVWRAIRDAG
jgi:carbon-monoxide dehydrogenase large subunit